VASAEIRRADTVVTLDAGSFFYVPFAARKNALWLEALFRKTFTTSSTNGIARHLVLSVLQI
jgi:hypothetical protein